MQRCQLFRSVYRCGSACQKLVTWSMQLLLSFAPCFSPWQCIVQCEILVGTCSYLKSLNSNKFEVDRSGGKQRYFR
ncbi:hypothetical protein CPC08DRAFT_225207 [Agrocybe pediades]|nr:hypothetical protein CPC08DRAFT_225207 [Agrocybe pediades]